MEVKKNILTYEGLRKYEDELHDFTLRWKGSSNQRVIDVKKSLKNNKVVLYEEKELVGV